MTLRRWLSRLAWVTYQHPQGPWNSRTPRPPVSPPPNQPAYQPLAYEWSQTPPYPAATGRPAGQRSWWVRLPPVGKAALISGAAVMLCCGGLVTLGAVAAPSAPSTKRSAAAAPPSSPSDAETTGDPVAAQAGASPTPLATTPTIEKRTVTETKTIPFTTRRVNDSSLAKGSTKVRTRGVAGVKTLTYEVTLANGVQTGKKLLRQVVTKAPVTQVIAVGTKQTRRCDPNYSGACVPIASDVDCAGGSGNGPAYVQGPVRVIGDDIYDLDRDGDGVGCD